MSKKVVTICLSEEHVKLLEVVIGCGIAKSNDEVIAESLDLFKSLIQKYVNLLDCSCVPIQKVREEDD